MANKQEEFESKMNMINALRSLQSACIECSKNDIKNLKDYPLSQNIDIVEWAENNINQIKKSL
jgi:hypothetical protein